MARKPTGRPNGRPKGARNKPKSGDVQPPQELPRVATGTTDEAGGHVPASSEAASLPDGTASLLAYHHGRLTAIAADLAKARADKASLTKDLAPLIAAESTCLKAIAELTGATKLTPAKIFASDVWRSIELLLATALVPFPEARAAIRAALSNAESNAQTEVTD